VDQVGIFFIVEPGKLEYQVEIFVKSLRLFGGIENDLPIYCFQPRKSGQLSKRTLQLFDENRVVFEKINLNKAFFFYPLANKILAGEYFEKKYGHRFERIIFFDSDFLVQGTIQKLVDLFKPIGLTPEFISTWAITKESKLGLQWQIVMDRLSLKTEDFWETSSSFDARSILTYYNGGLICTLSKLMLFSKWKNSFMKIMKDPRVLRLDHNEFYFLEMASLAGTLVKERLKDDIEELPLTFNFPLELTVNHLENASLIHYMDYFTTNDFRSLPLNQGLMTIIEQALKNKREQPHWVRFFQILKYQYFKLRLLL